ncbi:MAG: uncharacterized protein KVP18_002506 [Porospora cf. gigantea A]|uniref:uncharacterized protein n=1 Tax=Porospora cf. gigantea A TaxID=2853593 RepID=UPI003559741A|nr:MAG: hypothetical protein KVP18_002506 [Porospora cf. gigantea A]
MLFKQFKHEIRMYAREELSPQKIMNESLRPNLIPIRGGNVSVTLLDWKDVALSKGRLSTAMVAKTERREDSRKNFSHATYARRLSQLHPDFSRFYLTKAHPEAPSPEASAESFLDAEARWGNHDGMNANMNRKLIEYYQQWKELQRPHAAEAESPRELQSVALTRRGFTQIELTPPETGPRCRLLTQSTPSDDDEMEMLPPDSAPETFCMPSSVSSYDTAEEVFTGYYHVRPARWDILMWYRRKFFQFELMPTWARIPGLNGQNFLANDRASLTAYHVSLRPAGIAKDLYDWTASDDRDWNAPPLFNTVFLREDGYRVNEWAEGEAPYGPDMWGSSAFSNDGAVTSSDAAYKMLQHGGRSDSEYAARIQHRRTLLANGSEAATRRRLTLKVLPARNLTVPQRSLGSRLREWITQPSKPRVVL